MSADEIPPREPRKGSNQAKESISAPASTQSQVDASGALSARQEQDLRLAIGALSSYSRTLVTVAIGTLALAGTVIKNLGTGHDDDFLLWGAILLGISIFFGAYVLRKVFEQLRDSAPDPKHEHFEGALLIQLVTLLTGVALIIGFAVSGSPLATATSPSGCAPSTHSGK